MDMWANRQRINAGLCPYGHCGSDEIELLDVDGAMSDLRFEYYKCVRCGGTWYDTCRVTEQTLTNDPGQGLNA